MLAQLLFHDGDRLERDEFLALWEEMPDLKFAELIDGVVYLRSVRTIAAGDRDAMIQYWAGLWAAQVRVAQALRCATWLMADCVAQPHLSVRILPEFGGQSRNEGELAAGAPEFISELSPECPRVSLYERAGVNEYLLVDARERLIEWRVLRDGRYELLRPDSDGVYKSEVFPGLWLNEPAFWKLDRRGVLAVLEQGLQSPEFAAFQAKYQKT